MFPLRTKRAVSNKRSPLAFPFLILERYVVGSDPDGIGFSAALERDSQAAEIVAMSVIARVVDERENFIRWAFQNCRPIGRLAELALAVKVRCPRPSLIFFP